MRHAGSVDRDAAVVAGRDPKRPDLTNDNQATLMSERSYRWAAGLFYASIDACESILSKTLTSAGEKNSSFVR